MRRSKEPAPSSSTAWISTVLLFAAHRVGGLLMKWGDSARDDWETSRMGVSSWGAAVLWFFSFGVWGVAFALVAVILNWAGVDPTVWLAWAMVGLLALALGGGVSHGLAYMLSVEEASWVTDVLAVLSALGIALIAVALQ